MFFYLLIFLVLTVKKQINILRINKPSKWKRKNCSGQKPKVMSYDYWLVSLGLKAWVCLNWQQLTVIPNMHLQCPVFSPLNQMVSVRRRWFYNLHFMNAKRKMKSAWVNRSVIFLMQENQFQKKFKRYVNRWCMSKLHCFIIKKFASN